MYRQAINYARDLSRIYAEERSKREKLELAYQVLDAVFNNTPDSIIVLDDQRRIQQINQHFQDVMERDSSLLEGQAIADVLPAEVVWAIDSLATDPAAPRQLEFIMTKPVQRVMLATLTHLESGSLSGWIITLQDQSNRKRMDYQKAEFINIASHELFTPLGHMIGYAELLRDSLQDDLKENAKNKTYMRFLESILRAGKRLKSIVDELVEFAVLNTGHTEVAGITEFRLLDLINALDTDLKRIQVEQKVSVQIDLAEPELQVTMNGALLRTALYQIVLNGITFNKPGGYVRIQAVRLGDDILIDVADSGIGIAKTDLEGIFHPFIQVEDHNTRSKNGLGLGLSIAQRSIKELSGTLTVDSTLGLGSIFHIRLPRHQEAQKPDRPSV